MNQSNNLDLILNTKSKNNIKNYYKKVSSSNFDFLGVSLPELNKIIKNNKFRYSDLSFSNVFEKNYFIFASYFLNNNFEDSIKFIINNSSYFKGWELVDSVYKYIKYPEFLNECKPYFELLLQNKNNYIVRFVYVSLFKFVKNYNNLSDILSYFRKYNDYYIIMSQAWLLSDLYIYYSDEIIEFIKNNYLDKIVIDKLSIKINDSKRISVSNKNKFKELRRIIYEN